MKQVSINDLSSFLKNLFICILYALVFLSVCMSM